MPAREIYMREENDPNFKAKLLETSDEIEILIAQIKMILLTDSGDIMGAPDFGMNLEGLLFTFDANEFTLRTNLKNQISKFCPLAQKFNVDFDVKFFRGTVRDIAIIDVLINNTKVFGIEAR